MRVIDATGQAHWRFGEDAAARLWEAPPSAHTPSFHPGRLKGRNVCRFNVYFCNFTSAKEKMYIFVISMYLFSRFHYSIMHLNYSIFFFVPEVLFKTFFYLLSPERQVELTDFKKPMSLNLYSFSVRSSMEETINNLILYFRMQSCYIRIPQLLRVKISRNSIT